MRLVTALLIVLVMAVGTGKADAKEKSITELPKDIWNLVFVWTEPIKEAARESRRFDPVSGVWFGLLEGSVKSVERTAELFLSGDKDHPGAEYKSGKALLRYTF